MLESSWPIFWFLGQCQLMPFEVQVFSTKKRPKTCNSQKRADEDLNVSKQVLTYLKDSSRLVVGICAFAHLAQVRLLRQKLSETIRNPAIADSLRGAVQSLLPCSRLDVYYKLDRRRESEINGLRVVLATADISHI